MKSKKKKDTCLVATQWVLPAGARDSKTFLALTGSDGAAIDTGPSVGQEAQRAKAYEALKKQLRDECTSQDQSRYPSMAFERWWLSARDHGCSSPDPLLPTPRVPEDPTLMSDLEHAGFSRKEASQVSKRLAAASMAASDKLVALKKNGKEVVEVVTEKDDEVLLLCKSAGARIRFSAFAHKKLKKLHKFHTGSEGSFEQAAIVVGLRYQALGGSGFQLALPASAWKVLLEDFAVQAECYGAD